MGWLNNLFQKVKGSSPTDWTLEVDVPDPGLNIAGKPIVPDECYVELYVESLRLAKARKFATTFNGVIYAFMSLAREGADGLQLASVTKPQHLETLDPKSLGNVITVSKRVMPAVPWRGDPLGLQLGLFSVKSGNLLTPLINYVTKVSDQVGVSAITKLNPLLPLITEGLDMIAGQSDETEIELAIDTDIALAKSQFCALIAKPKQVLNRSDLSIDLADRKLLYKGAPLDAAYCVFSIRMSDFNPGWGAIQALRDAYEGFKQAILSNKHKEAEEALAAFNRQITVSPELITKDKERLKEKVRAHLREAFPGGGQSGDGATLARFKDRTLWDLNLY